MQLNFLKNRGGQASKAQITSSTFFNSENHVGYFNKDTFVEMMKQIKENAPGLYRNYVDFFSCVKEGVQITNSITRNTHQLNGQDYYHLRFRSGNLHVKTTIYEVEGLGRFIKDYANGLICTDFTLQELIEEANK